LIADQQIYSPRYFFEHRRYAAGGTRIEDTDDASHTHFAIVADTQPTNLARAGRHRKKLSVKISPAGPFQLVRRVCVVIGIVKHIQAHSLTAKGAGRSFACTAAPRPCIAVFELPAPFRTFAAYGSRL